MEQAQIQSIVESLLFVSGEAVGIIRLMKIADATKEEVENALETLTEKYAAPESGLMLLRKNDAVQLVSHPQNSQFVEQLVKNELADSLSGASLEVLSIIAYRGPISKVEIEAIRGVNCNYTVRNLLMRGLISRLDNPNDARGYVYEISFEFLKKLGIERVEKLPDYAILAKDERVDNVINKD